MGRRKKGEPPALRKHASSGLAYVAVWNRDLQKEERTYFGPWGTKEASGAYGRWLADWTARQQESPVTSQQAQPTVAGAILDFLTWAEVYYVKEGKQTSEVACLRSALTPLNNLFGVLHLADLRPFHLHQYQQQGITLGWKRGTINDNVERCRRLIRWAAERELCDPALLHRLQTVRALEKGRTEAAEGAKVDLVDQDHLERVWAKLRAPWAALCRLHYHLGCRAEEVCELKVEDIQRERSGTRSEDSRGRWAVVPSSHKTQHMGQDRTIMVGKQAEAILLPILEGVKKGYLFLGKGRGRHAHLKYRGPVTVSGYRKALAGACGRARVPIFTPIQVRHTSLTRIREKYGESAAQAVAGHSSVNTTQIYTSRMDDLARKVADEWG